MSTFYSMTDGVVFNSVISFQAGVVEKVGQKLFVILRSIFFFTTLLGAHFM